MGKERPCNLGLTFGDVLLEPGYSNVIPSDTNIDSRFSKHIDLFLPIVSSAMDTVTEDDMAIALALQGGLGIIHKNLSIEEQSAQVRKVKRFESVLIPDPITVFPDVTIKEVEDLMSYHNISGVPVVDNKGKLKGIITKSDLIFEDDKNKKIKEVMIPRGKLITGEKGISIKKAKDLFRKHKFEKLPLVDKNDKLAGLITLRDILKRKEFPRANIDKEGRLYCGAAVGIGEETKERAEELLSGGVDCLVVDTAHAHTKKVFDVTKMLRRICDKDLVVGNIVTGEAAKDFMKFEVDAVKVGVGPGSICTTRVISGIGIPQLTAIQNVAEALKGKVPIIADGGITFSGDITKALAGGADSVMIGGLLAGTDEAPGDSILLEGRRFKVYRGMGSVDAMEAGSKDRYFQTGKLVPEGVVSRVPYKGPVSEVLFQLAGGLRSGMGYVGAHNIKELREKAKFIQVTNAGLTESHPHDVKIIKEPPNYEIIR
ncbi:IMP dehydrogenase [candidate division WOR-3 bacterium]|nr:IMP dehydrogenase [candidate division WOR-3 bacterium]